MVLGIDFNKERDTGKLKENPKSPMIKLMGYSKYLCPKCNANLKEAENKDLICLNGCHMPKAMKKRMDRLFISRNGKTGE